MRFHDPATIVHGPAATLSYDVVAHNDGWAIVVTPERSHSFATKHEAFDAAVEFARKLRFVGYVVHVHVHHEPQQLQRVC